MVQTKTACLEKIRRFIGQAKKEISVENVYLFGSHLSGKAFPDSDIDIAVISKSFEGVEPFERLVWLGKIAWKAGLPEIEALGYTPDEFQKANPWDFSSEIRRTGEPIV